LLYCLFDTSVDICIFIFVLLFFFFFQAEDGIRDLTVTGVQTCALPISRLRRSARRADGHPLPAPAALRAGRRSRAPARSSGLQRSEERRVGKECRSRGSTYH